MRVLDVASKTVSILSKAVYARALALSPDGTRLYISYQSGGPNGWPGHDAIGTFDAVHLQFLGSAAGFPNVGECLSVSPDGSQVWETGGDACERSSYDHIGCPVVPSTFLNILRASDRRLIQQVAFPGARIHCTSFAPNGTALVTSSEALLFLEPKQYRLVAFLPRDSTAKVAISQDGRFGYFSDGERRQIVVLELRPEIRAVTLDEVSAAHSDSVAVALLSSDALETKLIDPTTLQFGGKAIQRSATGLPQAWMGKVDGFEGLHLVVNLRRADLIGKSNVPFQGETYTGLAIQGTLEIGK